MFYKYFKSRYSFIILLKTKTRKERKVMFWFSQSHGRPRSQHHMLIYNVAYPQRPLIGSLGKLKMYDFKFVLGNVLTYPRISICIAYTTLTFRMTCTSVIYRSFKFNSQQHLPLLYYASIFNETFKFTILLRNNLYIFSIVIR